MYIMNWKKDVVLNGSHVLCLNVKKASFKEALLADEYPDAYKIYATSIHGSIINLGYYADYKEATEWMEKYFDAVKRDEKTFAFQNSEKLSLLSEYCSQMLM